MKWDFRPCLYSISTATDQSLNIFVHQFSFRRKENVVKLKLFPFLKTEPDLTEQPRCPPPPASPPPPKAKSKSSIWSLSHFYTAGRKTPPAASKSNKHLEISSSLCSDLFKGEIHLKKTPDWENYQERLYFFSTDESSWNESRRSCQDLGGDLVKIDSREEQEAEDRFWIGLTDAEEEGRWFWVDGSPLNESLSFWSNGEPNNHAGRTPAGEDCVRMGKKGGADDLKCWFDHSCDGLQKSICEKPELNFNREV
uniref:CD209 antigen-like n=1 Tax=Fundulus heteroclitus TaxID=8078 RepID=A0A3Q2P6X4_FUNHE